MFVFVDLMNTFLCREVDNIDRELTNISIQIILYLNV